MKIIVLNKRVVKYLLRDLLIEMDLNDLFEKEH